MLAANGAAAVEESSDEGEDWDHPLMEVKRGAPAEASRAEASLAQPSLSALMGNSLPGVGKARGSSNRFNEAWVRSLHEEIQAEIESDGMKACTWERLLEKWSTHIRDAPYEKVELACAKQILQHARLTSASASPMFYETLRKLGKDVLTKHDKVDQRLLERLYPNSERDSKWYSGFFGAQDKWTPENLASHLKMLHGSSNIGTDLNQEKSLGFIVAHVRSNRYNMLEMHAIVKDLITGVEGVEEWKGVSKALDNGDGSEREAQSFIVRCVEAIHRERQSLVGTVKREAAAGVLLFGDVFNCTDPSKLERTQLDECFRASGSSAETLEELDDIIEEEHSMWKKWKEKHESKMPELKIKRHPLFSMMRAENLSSPSLMPTVQSTVKTYREKKINLLDWALKSSKAAIVKAIIDLDLSNQQESRTQTSTMLSNERRRIAVFGYHLDSNGRAVPDKADESVIVRTVPLTRKQEVSGSAGEAVELLDYRLFELGVSIAGSYIPICPTNALDLNDMLKTSGLGLSKDDNVDFMQFVRSGTHCPNGKPVDELLLPSEDRKCFTHVLLAVETGGSPGAAHSEIADAGGRFLIDIGRVGSVKTEGMRYQPLAVEPTASVSTSDDGKWLKRPFRRLTVLLPPSMVEYEKILGNLSSDLERGSGFSESAEIIAEVLSLVLIDKTNLEESKYKQIVQQNLKENPLLLYYTNIELLETVNPFFAQIIAEYWQEKLCSSGSNFAHLSRQEQEARDIILSLITSHRAAESHSGRQQQRFLHAATAETPRRSSQVPPMQDVANSNNMPSSQRCIVGKRVALATEAHLSQLPDLISMKTHFAQEEIFVEETNFESTYKRLKQASPTSLTFVFVYITGRISADQMKRIVEVPVPAIKLIFRYSSSIVDLLELMPSISEIIYKPTSICEALSGKLRPVPYSTQSAVGCVVVHTMRRLRAEPQLLAQPGKFWDKDGPEQDVAEASQWQLNLKKWLESGNAESESAFVRILITSDDKATAKSLQDFLGTDMEPPVTVRVVDAGDRLKFDGLRDFVESKTTTASLSYSMLKPSAESDAKSKPSPTRDVVVLSRASFLGHARLEVLVSRCAERGTKLILLVSEATSGISRFRVFKDARAPPAWIRVPTLTQKLLGGIGGTDYELSSDPSLLAFVGLQLLLSPELVVTEDHRTNVRQFLELRDVNVLEFMANFDCFNGDSSLRSDMVLALANVDSDDRAIRAAKCLAVVLAVHVNRYLRFREGSSSSLDPAVSFSDFCRQPKVRFLSQIHRIEAYMFFLFHQTDLEKRFVSETHNDKPFGWPLGVCFADLSNIHHAASPGPIMVCALSDTKVSSSNVTISIDLPVPQYVDPGKGDVVTQMQEIVEHRALAGSELHWQEMYHRWQSGAELTDDVLEHILVNSPCRMSVLLSMKPSHISNLSLSKDAIKAVSQDFEGCEDLLRSLPQAECNEFQDLRTRTAAIWWLLLTAGGSVKRVDDVVFGEEQSLLLDHGIMIQPKGEQGVDLLSRLTRVMISLDTENTLTSQHAVRDYLLSDDRRDAIAVILDDSGVLLGNAFMNAITSTMTLNAIMAGKNGSLIFDRLGSVLQWVKEAKDADADAMRVQMEIFASRITPEAIVTLLKSANPPADLAKARVGILLPCVRAQIGEEGKRHFLDAVLEPLCRHRPEMAVDVLEMLAKSDEQDELPEPHLENLPLLWRLMFRAMRSPASAQEFFAQVQEHKSENRNTFNLPFESSTTLCLMYIGMCKQSKQFLPVDLDRHELLLAGVLSRTAVFEQLIQCQDDIESNPALLALLYFTWWAQPGASIPLKLLPTPDTWGLFKDVTRRVKPNQRTVSKGMSILARFATAPHTLPASILNTLKASMVGGDQITSKTFVLAQQGSTTYPVYAFRTHTRHLPAECIDHLVKLCHGERKLVFKNDADKIRLLFPWTDSGVSQGSIEHNLNILVNIEHAVVEIESKVDPEETCILQAQLFLTTLTWFESAGFTIEHLKQMCVSNEDKGKLMQKKIELSAVWEKDNFAQMLVYQSLPVYVDVRFCSGKDVPLFQSSEESIAVTIQWLAMLTIQYSCTPNAPQEFYEFAQKQNNQDGNRVALLKKPWCIVTELFTDIADKLATKYSALELVKSGLQKFHVLLVLDDSGSMGGQWNSLVGAVKQYLAIREGVGAHDLVSIVIFNNAARVVAQRMPLAECVSKVDELLKFIGGGTSFAVALQKSLELLESHQETLPVAMLFMSDGSGNGGEAEMKQIVAKYSGIKVDTMAFGQGADCQKLQALADLAGSSGSLRRATDAVSLGRKFAEVASQLSQRPRNTNNEAQFAKEASMNRACSNVVGDILPVVDFFGQLRASGSGEFVKCAMDGMSDGLKASNVALQVCVADALYMLLGITPANRGDEVRCMLQMWKEKNLTLGSSIVAEMNYMSVNVWNSSGLGEAKNLIELLDSIKRVGYVRDPANIPLASLRKQADQASAAIYAFNEPMPQISLPHLEIEEKIAKNASSAALGNGKAGQKSRRVADFDHAATQLPSSVSRGPGPEDAPSDSSSLIDEHSDFFSAAAKDDSSAFGQSNVRHLRQLSAASSVRARTISARDLVQIDTLGGGGYGVLRIVPGLHPVLRSPGDSCSIPVWQQKSLGRNRDSIEKLHGISHSKIEAIFSNNGATWDHLNQLPQGSTLMGNGFYLRKSIEGSWVLLVGAGTQESLDTPPYVLWSVLDTARLAALDFDDRVLDIFKGIVALAFKPSDACYGFPSDPDISKILKQLRKSSLNAVDQSAENAQSVEFYLNYIKRESLICQHILDCLDRIRDDTRGKRASATVLSALNLGDLEKNLSLPVKSTESWATYLCKQLGLLVGIRDWVPRSQLTFTLQLVLRNSESILKLHSEKRKPEELRSGEQNKLEELDASLLGTANGEFDAEDYNIFDESNGDVDHSNPTIPRDGDRQRAFSDVDNRLIAAHEHITQYKFNCASLAILKSMAQRKGFLNDSEWVKAFEDSDDDDDDAGKDSGDVARKFRIRKDNAEDSDEEDQVVDDSHKEKSLGLASSKIDEYEDDELDLPLHTECDSEHEALFPSKWGFGAPIFSTFAVTSVLAQHIPMYFVQIDVRRLKIAYSDSEGLPIAYIFHKKILRRSLRAFAPELGFALFCAVAGSKEDHDEEQEDEDQEKEHQETDDEVTMLRLQTGSKFSEEEFEASWSGLSPNAKETWGKREQENSTNTSRRANYKMLAYREELLRWLVDLIRSPLPTEAIHWFLDKLENGATTQSVPSLTAHLGANAKTSSDEEEIGGNLNLVVIAHCIAKALPSPNEAKDLFSCAFHVPLNFLPYVARKNDLYGIHIVRGGTRAKLEEYGAVVEICDLGYDALTRSKDNASMYLSIINKFSTFIWMVYVTGLDDIDDALLKWLAEYTKAHPWRFVYLENTQTSWNFSENRDRCVYDHAPPPVERGIKSEDDLKRTAVKMLRPTHTQPYPRVSSHCDTLHKKENQIQDMDWTQLSNHTRNFFSNSTETQTANTNHANWASCLLTGADDYRNQVIELMQNSEPCVLLLCSPPGAGKSHFANELAELVKTKIGLRRAFIDGSDDRLVDMALAEILKVELPDPKISQFLIVDEFHMLKDNHKCDLFEWLHVHARRLHVLLIANRKDARDEELLQDLRDHSSNVGLSSLRIKSFSTRLGNQLLNEVMDKRRTKGKEGILRWMHCSRCLFGGEAVSLRGIAKLEESLQKLQSSHNSGSSARDLVDLLLNKVPTVSEATAQDFVTCFRAALGKDTVEAMASVAQTAKGPVSTMVQASLLTESMDAYGTDYPDFVANRLERAYDASPALRIAAWCCQMREAAKIKTSNSRITSHMLEKMDAPKPIFGTSFVDQCGFPLQLEVKSKTDLSEGLAFSWGGDYTRMREIIDAVKHGHSVDWKDVHERCWQCEPVQDSALLVELLSVCTSPAKVLAALTKENLCALLKKSKPADALFLAKDVLKYHIHKSTAQDDKYTSPYRTSVWIAILFDKELFEPKNLLLLMSTDAAPLDDAPRVDWRESELADALVWASTHMVDTKMICSDDDPKRRLKFLVDVLVNLSHRLILTGESIRAAALWSGMFAPLLRTNIAHGKTQPKRKSNSSILIHVAMHGDDLITKWHEPLPSLWAIAHGKGTAAQVDKMWNYHRHLLFEDVDSQSTRVDCKRGALIPCLAGGILCVSGVIPYELQEAFLTGNCFVNMTKFEDITEDYERAMKLIRKALEDLVKKDSSKITIQEGNFKTAVMQEVTKIKAQDRSMIDDR